MKWKRESKWNIYHSVWHRWAKCQSAEHLLLPDLEECSGSKSKCRFYLSFALEMTEGRKWAFTGRMRRKLRYIMNVLETSELCTNLLTVQRRTSTTVFLSNWPVNVCMCVCVTVIIYFCLLFICDALWCCYNYKKWQIIK